jgi:hypothetical protein
MNGKCIASGLLRIAKKLLSPNEYSLDPLALDVAKFLQENPNPSDKDFHAWAEEKGYDVHESEAAAYRLATTFMKFMFGGRANEKGFTKEDADPVELSMGIEIEKEHSPDLMTRTRISLDHMAEFPDSPLGYYAGLTMLEKWLEKLEDMSESEAQASIEDTRAAMGIEEEDDD